MNLQRSIGAVIAGFVLLCQSAKAQGEDSGQSEPEQWQEDGWEKQRPEKGSLSVSKVMQIASFQFHSRCQQQEEGDTENADV